MTQVDWVGRQAKVNAQFAGLCTFGLLGLGYLDLVGLSMVESARVALALLLQTLGGIGLLSRLGDKSHENASIQIPVAFASGMVMTSICHVVLVRTPIEWASLWIPLVLLIPVWRRELGGKRRSKLELDPVALVWIVGISLISLGRVYRWQLAPGVAVLGLALSLSLSESLRLKSKIRQKLALYLPVAAGVALSALMWREFVDSRSPWWWTINSDITFTEMATRTLGSWGFNDHLAVAGNASFAEYHWLPFAWSGVMGEFGRLDSWVFTTRISQFVMTVLATWLIWLFFERTMGRGRIVTAFATTVAAVIAIPIGVNFTHLFGVVFLLALLLHVAADPASNRWIWRSLVTTVITLGLILSKPQLAVPGIAAISTFGLIQVIRERRVGRVFREPLLIGVALALATVFGIHQIYKDQFPLLSDAVKLGLVSVGSFGELGNARNLFAVPLALFSLSSTLVPLVAAMLVIWNIRSTLIPSRLLALCSFFAIGMTLIVSADYSQIAGYELSLVNSITGVALGLTITAIISKERSWRAVSLLVALAFSGKFLMNRWPDLFPNGPGGSVSEMTIRVMMAQRWVPAALLATCVFFVWVRTKNESTPKTLRQRLPLFVLGALSLSLVPVGSLMDSVQSTSLVDERIDTRFIAFNNPPLELVEMILSSTSEEEIIASNAFCTADQIDLCRGENWWSEYEDMVMRDVVPLQCIGNRKFALDASFPAMTNRRFLVQSPNYFDPCGEFPEWLNLAVVNSEIFARNPSQKSLDYLCTENVGWFVVDGLTASRTNWEPFARKVLEDGRFSLLKINEWMCG